MAGLMCTSEKRMIHESDLLSWMENLEDGAFRG